MLPSRPWHFLNLFFQPSRNRRHNRRKQVTLSKTRELGAAIDSEHLSEMTEEEVESSDGITVGSNRVRGFLYVDYKYLRPFFTRRLVIYMV